MYHRITLPYNYLTILPTISQYQCCAEHSVGVQGEQETGPKGAGTHSKGEHDRLEYGHRATHRSVQASYSTIELII